MKEFEVFPWLMPEKTFRIRDGRVDLFYGKDKVFITIYASKKLKQKVMNNLEEFCDFVENKDDQKKKGVLE